jgi:hypothetical protein
MGGWIRMGGASDREMMGSCVVAKMGEASVVESTVGRIMAREGRRQ